MKYKTTEKAVKNGYKYVVRIPYCALQSMLAYKSPIAYTAGSYGWKADIYDFDNVAIVTGYSPFGNIKPDYDTIRSFEKEADNIRANISDFTEKVKALEVLIIRFLDQVC